MNFNKPKQTTIAHKESQWAAVSHNERQWEITSENDRMTNKEQN